MLAMLEGNQVMSFPREFSKTKWTTYYLHRDRKKPVCLVCYQQMSVLKEYNIRHHCETQRAAKKYNILQG